MQNFQSGHLHFMYFIIVYIVGLLAKTCTPRLLGKASSGTWVVWLAGGQLPLPPNSLLGRVHFGFSQGRLVPCNFCNARTIHCRELQLCNLLHHSIGRLRPGYGMPPTLYHPSWCYALLFSCYVVLRWQQYITPRMLCFASICFFMQYVPLTTLDHPLSIAQGYSNHGALFKL